MTDENDDRIERLRPFMIPAVHITIPAGPTADALNEIDRQVAVAHRDRQRARKAEAEAEQLRVELDRRQRKELYGQVIERFNRAHGQNPKITLADICAEMDVSYEAVRKYRQRAPKHKTKK